MAARPTGAAATSLSVALALVSLCTSIADAQSSATRGVAPSQNASASASQSPQALTASVRRRIDQLRSRSEGRQLPPADSFTVGPRALSAAATVRGNVAVAEGSLDVFGRLDGNAYVVDGDIVIHNGGSITGDAVSFGGRVLLDGGRVEGERVALSAPTGELVRAAQARAPMTTWQSIKLVLGWFAILAIIGIGVLIFAESNMDGVVEAMEGSFAKAFWFGVLGQIVALPVLTLLCIALVLTVIGILLVPFAAVAYCIAVAGLLALGFLAVARLTGSFWSRSDPVSASAARGANVRALFIGLVLYMGLWLLAAIFSWQPIASAVLRGVAFSVSWVAVTVGLGAAILSRAGTKRLDARQRAGGSARRPAPEDLTWQTPTPVAGVAAARRPVATAIKDAS